MMVKYLGPRLRIVRRLGNLPGLTAKISQKITPPGQHGTLLGKKKKQESIYKIRLFEKQKLRYNYGITERQLQRYVREARRKKGSTAFFLMQLLEMRLDTIIFRLSLAPTIPAARQFVNHGHFLINNNKVNIPSFQCHPKDIITIQKSFKSRNLAKNNLLQNNRFIKLPTHLSFDQKFFKAKVLDLVNQKDLSFKVNELLIIEYYSRIL
jgi:small subunit ribosomal protein S4